MQGYYNPAGVPYKMDGGGGGGGERSIVGKRYQASAMWTGLELLLTPKRYKFLNDKLLSALIFFRFNTLKNYCTSSLCGPFEAEYPKRN